MTDSTYVGSERFQDPDESPFMPRKFKVSFQCEVCGHHWSRVYKAVPTKNPPCPDAVCKSARDADAADRAQAKMAAMLEEQRAPGVIGGSIVTKAVDETARIVMEDHKMTNLQDNVRDGDMVAPKLPGMQQKMADGFFGGKAVAERNGIGTRQMEMLGRRAIAGAFRSTAINPDSLVPGTRGQPALRHVKTERLG